MHEWNAAGFFAPELALNRVGETEYIPLAVLLRVASDPNQPFTSPIRPPPPPQPPVQTPINDWQHHQQPPARQFTTDYDPLGRYGRPARPPTPYDHQGRPASRSASGPLDPWGVPIPQQPSTPLDPWHHQQQQLQQRPPESQYPRDQPVNGYTPAHSLASGRHPWEHLGAPQHTPSFDEAVEPLLPTAKSVLPQPIGTPKYALSPSASYTNLDALGGANEVEKEEEVLTQEPEVEDPMQELVDSWPIDQPPAAAVVEQDGEEEPKGNAKSKRAAAKEAKEAIRQSAREATVAQPEALWGDLPKETEAEAASGWDDTPAEAPSATGWNDDAAPALEATPTRNEVISPSVSTAAKTPAPWKTGKEEGSLTLREIQAREAKASEQRKAIERQQRAAAAAAHAATEAAQALADAHASLPSSSNWAGGAAGSEPSPPIASPWAKPKISTNAKVVGKSLKEIQEEEARRKKAALLAQQGTATASVGARGGYAGLVASSSLPPKPVRLRPLHMRRVAC